MFHTYNPIFKIFRTHFLDTENEVRILYLNYGSQALLLSTIIPYGGSRKKGGNTTPTQCQNWHFHKAKQLMGLTRLFYCPLLKQNVEYLTLLIVSVPLFIYVLLLLSFLSFAFDPLREISRGSTFVSPNITRRYMQKNILFR